MNDELDYFVVDDEAEETDASRAAADEERQRALRAERGVLRRNDLRRTRTYSWVGCLTLLGAAVKLASLAWRGWRTGNAASLVVFGGLLVMAVVAAALLAIRARTVGRALDGTK